MNHSQFFKEGRWMPSFTLFGNREIVFHHPIQAEGRNSTISSITLNPSYPAQTHLVEKLSQEIYELTTNLSLHPQSTQSLKMSHLRSMMSHVVKASERGTESYHNILYLAFKYLAYLLSREAAQKMILTEDEVTIQSWLADVHSIYFQASSEESRSEDQIEEDRILFLLKKGDYEQIVQELRCYYCLTDPNDKDTLQKLDLLISILLIKLNSKNNKELLHKGLEEQAKGLSQKVVQTYEQKLTKIIQTNKKQSQKKGQFDLYSFVAKILLGDEAINEKMAQKSWPLFLLNHISFGNPKLQNPSPSTVASNFLKKTNNYGKASERQTQFYFKMLNRESSHHIYQSMLQIVPLFYGHFIGYLLTVIQPSPVPNVFVEDYTLDLMRNLLDHSSQISFKALILIFRAFDENSVFGQKLSQSFQLLLQHHLNVIDESDQIQLQEFLLKVKILSKFKLQRYAYFQLNLLLNNFLQKGKVDRQTFLIYANCSMLFSSYYNYEDLLGYYLENIFVNQPKKLTCLTVDIKNVKNELQGGREKKLLKEICQIEPLLQKYQLTQ